GCSPMVQFNRLLDGTPDGQTDPPVLELPPLSTGETDNGRLNRDEGDAPLLLCSSEPLEESVDVASRARKLVDKPERDGGSAAVPDCRSLDASLPLRDVDDQR